MKSRRCVAKGKQASSTDAVRRRWADAASRIKNHTTFEDALNDTKLAFFTANARKWAETVQPSSAARSIKKQAAKANLFQKLIAYPLTKVWKTRKMVPARAADKLNKTGQYAFSCVSVLYLLNLATQSFCSDKKLPYDSQSKQLRN